MQHTAKTELTSPHSEARARVAVVLGQDTSANKNSTEQAARLAMEHRATLILLTLVKPKASFWSFLTPALADARAQLCDLNRWARRFRKLSISVETRVCVSPPEEVAAFHASLEEHYDWVFLANSPTRHRSPARTVLPRSVQANFRQSTQSAGTHLNSARAARG